MSRPDFIFNENKDMDMRLRPDIYELKMEGVTVDIRHSPEGFERGQYKKGVVWRINTRTGIKQVDHVILPKHTYEIAQGWRLK